jgi:flagellar hook assembly protein FlgD
MTAVRFTMLQAGMARIGVFNVQGRLVRRLMNANRSEGVHEVIWRGEDESGRAVASGNYTLRLDLAGETVLRRIVLLKWYGTACVKSF